MKKRFFNIFSLTALLSIGLFSCQDEILVKVDDPTNANLLLDSIAKVNNLYVTLNKENGDLVITNQQLADEIERLLAERELLNDPEELLTEIDYTINVLSAGDAELSELDFPVLAEARAKDVLDATVKVEQNGTVFTPQSQGNGLYLIRGLRTGYVFVTISAPNHSTVEYKAYVDGDEESDELPVDVVNSSAQIILYPISGSLAGKIVGKAYANTTTVNDTLSRRYGDDESIFGANAGNYISGPTNWQYTNYGSGIKQNIYGGISGDMIQFENAKAGHRIYAFPQLSNDYDIPSENGYIVSVTYRDIITSAAINADGNFELPVIAANETYGLIDDIWLESDHYAANFTSFTGWENGYYGGENESGSSVVTLDYYNNMNTEVEVYSGVDSDLVSVPSNTSVAVSRRAKTSSMTYWPYFPNQGEVNDTNVDVRPGETIHRNIFFFAYDDSDE